MCFLSHADKILKTINIEINVSWNSTSINASVKTSVNSAETCFSTDFTVTSERAMTAVVLSESSSHIELTLIITQLSKAGLSVETQMNSFVLTGSSWSDYCSLTDSALTASQSSGLNQSNSSLWAINSMRLTVQASLSSFAEKVSARKVSKEDTSMLIILDCVIEIFL